MAARIMLDNRTWIVMRTHPSMPAGIIAHVEVTTPEGHKVWKYRAVRWAPEPSARTLIGYYDTVDQADTAVPVVRPVIETSRSDRSFARYPDHPVRAPSSVPRGFKRGVSEV
jgi:hypothetical protein